MTRIASVALAVVLCACSGRGGERVEQSCTLVEQGYGPQGTVAITTEVVANGLEVPWGLGFLPNGDVLVTERPGRVRLIRGGALQPSPVAQLAVAADGEGGLLGIAVHPDFASNRAVYFYLTVNVGAVTNQVERWILSPDGTSAHFDRVILAGIPGARVHDGGRMRFGPDGMLYVGTGDARQPERSQDPASLAGKLLRLTPDGNAPADNPVPGQAAFLWGIRNTQGFDWLTPDLLALSDHGPSGEFGRTGHDELNIVRRGENLGWPELDACQRSGDWVTPVLTWERALPPGGLAVYTGARIPEWTGSVLIGALGSQQLHRVQMDPTAQRVAVHEVYLEQAVGRIREVVQSPDGELYLTTSNCDGRGECPPDKDQVLRVVPGR